MNYTHSFPFFVFFRNGGGLFLAVPTSKKGAVFARKDQCWGVFLVPQKRSETPARNGYNAQGANLNIALQTCFDSAGLLEDDTGRAACA